MLARSKYEKKTLKKFTGLASTQPKMGSRWSILLWGRLGLIVVPRKPQKNENFHFTWCGYIGFRARCYVKQRMFWQNHLNEWIFLPGPKLLRFVSTNIFHFGAVGKTFCFSDYAIIVICNIHHRLQSANITKVSGSISA